MRLIFPPPFTNQFPPIRLLLLHSILFLSAFATTLEWHFEPPSRQMQNDDIRAAHQPRKSYRGFKLLRINPRTEGQLEWLRRLHQSDTNSAPPFYNLDFWQAPSHLGALVDLTVSPDDGAAFFAELKRRNIDYLVMNDDLEELIERERAGMQGEGKTDGFRDDEFGSIVGGKEGGNEPEYRYDRYNPLSRIEEQLFRLREQNPRILTLFEIGKSHENRSIVTAKISAREHTSDERWHPFRGSAVWIDAGIHAREWIAPATAMLLLSKLVNGYNSADVNIRYLVESIDWYITPVMNPDGYEYSHTKNRMWRKNRRPAFCKQQYFNRICCSGVDLNRNFDWFWSITGSSSDPCHETYHGPSAFSEPESRAVRDFLEEHPVKAFISLHSYSQLWLIPYGHKRRNYPEDYHTVQRPLSLRAVKALQRLYGTEYQVGSGADLLYEASGSSHDFAKGILNIPFSFLVELRPQNTLHSTGFLLPEAEIADTADETWEAIKVVADKVLERFAPFVDGRKNWKGFTKSENGSAEMSTTTKKANEITEELTTVSTTPKSTSIPASTKKTTQKENSPKARPTTKMAKTLTSKKPAAKITTTESSIRSSTNHFRHTFLPNTITTDGGDETLGARSSTPSALTSKSLPVATTLVAPLSVRNNAKTGSSRGTTGAGKPTSNHSGGSPEKGEEEKKPPPSNGGGGETGRKTIVNVKICTGGKELLKGLPFPPGESSSSIDEGEEEEIGEEDKELLPIPQSTSRRRLIKCRDWSSYCKWWRMHSLCTDQRVRKMCTLSCLIECQI